MGEMTLAEILDRSIEVLKKHIKTIILFTVAYGILAFIGVILFSIVGALIVAFSEAALQSGYFAIFIVILAAIIIASIALTHYMGIIKISSQEFSNEEVLTDTAIKVSFKSVFKIFSVLICLIIMFIPIIVLFYFMGKALFGSFDFLTTGANIIIGREAGAIILTILFILFLCFIFFSYAVWIVFVFHAMVLEQKGVFASIKRSFVLVRHSFWRIFGSLLLISCSVYALQLSLGGFAALVSSVFYMVAKFLSINQDIMSFFTMVADYISLPLSIVSWLVIMPVGYIMITMLYFNERFKKEGYDIALRLKTLQKNQERKQVSELNN